MFFLKSAHVISMLCNVQLSSHSQSYIVDALINCTFKTDPVQIKVYISSYITSIHVFRCGYTNLLILLILSKFT